MKNKMNEDFTINDLEKILEIKDRVIRTLLFGGGSALLNEEKIQLENLLNKAKNHLKTKVFDI